MRQVKSSDKPFGDVRFSSQAFAEELETTTVLKRREKFRGLLQHLTKWRAQQFPLPRICADPIEMSPWPSRNQE